MPDAEQWRQTHEWSAQQLRRQTGHGVREWTERIRATGITCRDELADWLTMRGVNGYAQELLVAERFGLLPTAEELLERQYADRPHLRPVLDELIETGLGVAHQGQVHVDVRETHVVLRTKRRKFAVVKASAKTRVDLGLRLAPDSLRSCFAARLQSAKLLRDGAITHRIPLRKLEEVDPEVSYWVATAYADNTWSRPYVESPSPWQVPEQPPDA